jgi:hypothetical protein
MRPVDMKPPACGLFDLSADGVANEEVPEEGWELPGGRNAPGGRDRANMPFGGAMGWSLDAGESWVELEATFA